MINKIYNLNYEELIKEMKTKNIKVDAIITDPPYNVSRKNQLGFSNMGRAGMDYGEWDYKFDQVKWIDEVNPFLKPGGSIIIFNDWKNMSNICSYLENKGYKIKDLIRMVKTNPMPRNTSRRYVSDCEYAIWAVKPGDKWTFNKPEEKNYLKPELISTIVPGGKNRIHPTQKNLKSMQDIIKIHTNPNDIIFDPFSGSGSISLAAKIEGRNYISSEISKTYWLKSIERIKKHEKS